LHGATLPRAGTTAEYINADRAAALKAQWRLCSKQLAEQFLGLSPLLLDRSGTKTHVRELPCRNQMAHRAPGCAEQMSGKGPSARARATDG
jgi:hypothetical protein